MQMICDIDAYEFISHYTTYLIMQVLGVMVKTCAGVNLKAKNPPTERKENLYVCY